MLCQVARCDTMLLVGILMKLTIPPIKIEDNEGFDPTKDIFKRKDFGERLANLIENIDESVVLALDAQWGEGKSTFIKMWKGYIAHHRENKIKTIYFDAFANDYQKDPFLALASEIYELLKDESKEKKKRFKVEAGKAAKSLIRGAIKIGIRAGTGGILDGSFVDSAEKDISTLIADQVDNVIAERLQSSTKDKLAIKEFKEYLETLAKEHGNGNPLVFIVDELDRCRPDFALELIEQIKHLFSVSGITFLLVMNRKQLEASVNKRYGQSVIASIYLHKFINLWLTLPRKTGNVDHGSQYLRYALGQMLNDNEKVKNDVTTQVLIELVELHQPSYREIEQILSYFALLHNMESEFEKGYIDSYQHLLAFICYLKSAHHTLITLLSNNSISAEELFKKSGLGGIDDDMEDCRLFYLKKYIKFDLADETMKKEMVEKNEIQVSDDLYFRNDNVMVSICGWLVNIVISD